MLELPQPFGLDLADLGDVTTLLRRSGSHMDEKAQASSRSSGQERQRAHYCAACRQQNLPQAPLTNSANFFRA
jgi:hypothetical protein